MSSSEDEDDKFLYGSDTEEAPSSNKRSLDTIDEQTKRRKVDTPQQPTATIESDEYDSESDDESDVEFILSTGPDIHRLDSNSTLVASSTTPVSTIQPVVNAISVATDELAKDDETQTPMTKETTTATNGYSINNDETATLTSDSLKNNNTMLGSIDLDKDGLFEGESITNIDPEVLREKPWRQPGANLSDYFNYGFNEYTWTEYLNRQEKLRADYNPRRILMGLMTLQQQGRLDPQPKQNQTNQNIPSMASPMPNTNQPQMNMNMNYQSIPNNMMNNQNKPNNAAPPMLPAGFPPAPFGMFGGFGFPPPPFMAQQPNLNPNQNSNPNPNQSPNSIPMLPNKK
ncbi:hypothetical protein NCAS_0H00600 [Naumovozyma castellii]|uniref:Pre-mRNA polyadenylation factor FIP1 n=1 Tax=Naumovozyma castellii TaxID=27288 RepID=G0VIP4_NAUCA|nr:hypothetical protein NCAS_0H00600 [Naumovozyma castellii CBS 4309]CCC71370.1 hypothetical protein NCAS_0H00600 [Naumovozyma castellii CBS 4309]